MYLGYSYISKLLRGDSVKDHTEDRKIVNIFKPDIIDRISADLERVMDYLLTYGVLVDQDKEPIQCEKERRGKWAGAALLVERIPRRNPNWFEKFLLVLRRCEMDDVARKLDVPEFTTDISC